VKVARCRNRTGGSGSPLPWAFSGRVRSGRTERSDGDLRAVAISWKSPRLSRRGRVRRPRPRAPRGASADAAGSRVPSVPARTQQKVTCVGGSTGIPTQCVKRSSRRSRSRAVRVEAQGAGVANLWQPRPRCGVWHGRAGQTQGGLVQRRNGAAVGGLYSGLERKGWSRCATAAPPRKEAPQLGVVWADNGPAPWPGSSPHSLGAGVRPVRPAARF
jgi:hypothetical protein